MTVEFRYARFGEDSRIREFLDEYWARNHVYVRIPRLFDWTFGRQALWDHDGYSFVLAENAGQIVGILGGVPFVFNCLGRTSRGMWLANYMVRPDHRKGPTAMRLLGMFRRPPYDVIVAFGVAATALPIYRLLRWRILDTIPRHFAVLPNAVERMVQVLHLVHADWPAERLKTLANSFKINESPEGPIAQYQEILPSTWNEYDWPQWAMRTVGGVRDLDYLRWRYLDHPVFHYRVIAIAEGKRTGLAVWRLETIRRVTLQGDEAVDRIGRLVEFLPTSQQNAKDILSVFWHELSKAEAFGADYYNYHGETQGWLKECGFLPVDSHPDGQLIPARFQPLESRSGRIMSAVFVGNETVPACSTDAQCPWYWTKSDADQDRPN